MKKRTAVSKIMSTDIISVNKTQTLQDVNKLIKDNSIHHVPVVSGGNVIGMLSKTDLQKISFVNTFDGDSLTTAMYDALTIEQVMTKELSVVKSTDTIYDVAVILSTKDFHALPVLEDGKLVGIVTSRDLIKYLLEQY